MAPSICFEDNYIKFDLKDDVKGVDLDGRYFANHTTTNRTWTLCSSEPITVYYLDSLDHPHKKFPVKQGANFTPGETVHITGGAFSDTEVIAKDQDASATGPDVHTGIWGY